MIMMKMVMMMVILKMVMGLESDDFYYLLISISSYIYVFSSLGPMYLIPISQHISSYYISNGLPLISPDHPPEEIPSGEVHKTKLISNQLARAPLPRARPSCDRDGDDGQGQGRHMMTRTTRMM